MEGSIYSALNTSRVEIRLFTLYPGAREEPVRGGLHHVFLDDEKEPEYETISYCWGDKSIRDIVWIDESPLSVASSTASALRRMRLVDSNRILWIDGVCIDQSNRDECSRQVQFMTEIYGKSRGNLVHLSESDHLTVEHKERIQSIALEAREELRHNHEFSFFREHSPASRRCEAGLAAIGSLVLEELYQQPLWQRLWILQELVMSAENTVFCGRVTLDLKDLAAIIIWLGLRLVLFEHVITGETVIVLSRNAKFWTYCHYWLGTGFRVLSSRASLWSIIDSTGSSDTTLMHDRIYAVLGLYRRVAALSTLPPLLEPNYDKPLTDVFRDAMRFMIQEERSLDILEDRVPKSRDLQICGLPSWVRRWYRPTDRELYPFNLPRLGADFQASGSSLPVSITQNDFGPNCLLAAGLKIGNVSQILPTLTTDAAYIKPSSLVQWISAIQSETPLMNYHDNRKFGMTLLAGITSDNRHPTNEDISGVEVLIQHIQCHETFASDHTCAQCKGNCAPCFQEALRHSCLHRRVFFTASGLMGLGNEDVQPGDELVILQGGSRPFILRPTDGNHTLVCVCYVDGLMYGEAWKGEDDERLKRFHIY